VRALGTACIAQFEGKGRAGWVDTPRAAAKRCRANDSARAAAPPNPGAKTESAKLGLAVAYARVTATRAMKDWPQETRRAAVTGPTIDA
jgi:hypothetical protein